MNGSGKNRKDHGWSAEAFTAALLQHCCLNVQIEESRNKTMKEAQPTAEMWEGAS
jgi:hypothetical protein